MIPGLLVLHVRKGDFENHCANLADWGAMWNGMNRFPQFVDKFEVPPRSDGTEVSPETRAHYMKHCLPTIPEIIAKVEEVASSPEGEGLKYIYVMTNGKTEWAEELKVALGNMGVQGPSRADSDFDSGGADEGEQWLSPRWEKVATRRDLALDWEQTFVSQAVDMLIGQRAQVLIGNGVSSFMLFLSFLRLFLPSILSPSTPNTSFVSCCCRFLS